MINPQYQGNLNTQQREYHQVAQSLGDGSLGGDKKSVPYGEYSIPTAQMQPQAACRPVLEPMDNFFPSNLSYIPYLYAPAFADQRMYSQMIPGYAPVTHQDAQNKNRRVGAVSNQYSEPKLYSNMEMQYSPYYPFLNSYNPVYFPNQQLSMQYVPLASLKRDTAAGGMYSVGDKSGKKQQVVQQPQMLRMHAQQMGSVPVTPQIQQKTANSVYQQNLRSYQSYSVKPGVQSADPLNISLLERGAASILCSMRSAKIDSRSSLSQSTNPTTHSSQSASSQAHYAPVSAQEMAQAVQAAQVVQAAQAAQLAQATQAAQAAQAAQPTQPTQTTQVAQVVQATQVTQAAQAGQTPQTAQAPHSQPPQASQMPPIPAASPRSLVSAPFLISRKAPATHVGTAPGIRSETCPPIPEPPNEIYTQQGVHMTSVPREIDEKRRNMQDIVPPLDPHLILVRNYGAAKQVAASQRSASVQTSTALPSNPVEGGAREVPTEQPKETAEAAKQTVEKQEEGVPIVPTQVTEEEIPLIRVPSNKSDDPEPILVKEETVQSIASQH